MKKRIGTLYNKPIIEGDINLKTPNEIHKDELKGGGGGETESQKEYYYLFDGEKYIIDKGITEDNFSSKIMELQLYMGPVYSCLFQEDKGVHDYTIGTVKNAMASSLTFWKKVLGVRLKDGASIVSFSSDTQDIWIVKGDIYTRTYLLRKHAFNQEINIDEVKEDMKKYFTEVTKEEYESYIDVPITIL